MKRIFFVEYDASLRSGLTFALEKQGYAVTSACTREEAQTLWRAGGYDLVILDVSLPDGSGYDLCREIRRTSQVPLIFLTAADEETEVIMGLDLGGDDYITKPFKLAVFFSRINALLRRSGRLPESGRQLAAGGVTVDLLQQTVTRNGVPVDLTATEYKLLCFLMENPGRVLSAEQILGRLWDNEENYIDSSTLTVYIRRLRTKIEEDPAHPQNILTVRGMGYKWSVTP